jgi:hypothetical protein
VLDLGVLEADGRRELAIRHAAWAAGELHCNAMLIGPGNSHERTQDRATTEQSPNYEANPAGRVTSPCIGLLSP